MLLGEGLFGMPMIVAFALASWIASDEARRVILTFQVGFAVIALGIFYWTFTGEHDAQYQLALLWIPLFGFPAVAIAGLIAARLR